MHDVPSGHWTRRTVVGLLAGSFTAASAYEPLAPGTTAPDFVLPATTGGTLRLSDLLAESAIVLVFYPKAFTSRCTKQMEAYQAAHESLAKLDARVIGISTDDADTNLRFALDRDLDFPLLSDVSGRVATQYGVYNPLAGLAGRSTFVVGTDGVIAHAEHGEAAMALAAVMSVCERMGE